MDPTGNSSEEVAMVVKHSLVQKEVPKKLSGQTTNNGGGGVLEHLGEELQELGITNEKFYFIANCTLYNLLLAVAVPVEKVFGLGGIEKNNFMQMLHSIYDLQQFYNGEVWCHIMQIEINEYGMENEDVPNKIQQPVTTR